VALNAFTTGRVGPVRQDAFLPDLHCSAGLTLLSAIADRASGLSTMGACPVVVRDAVDRGVTRAAAPVPGRCMVRPGESEAGGADGSEWERQRAAAQRPSTGL
jgi:hypothetical protein